MRNVFLHRRLFCVSCFIRLIDTGMLWFWKVFRIQNHSELLIHNSITSMGGREKWEFTEPS